jgi:hypothetical protein
LNNQVLFKENKNLQNQTPEGGSSVNKINSFHLNMKKAQNAKVLKHNLKQSVQSKSKVSMQDDVSRQSFRSHHSRAASQHSNSRKSTFSNKRPMLNEHRNQIIVNRVQLDSNRELSFDPRNLAKNGYRGVNNKAWKTTANTCQGSPVRGVKRQPYFKHKQPLTKSQNVSMNKENYLFKGKQKNIMTVDQEL